MKIRGKKEAALPKGKQVSFVSQLKDMRQGKGSQCESPVSKAPVPKAKKK